MRSQVFSSRGDSRCAVKHLLEQARRQQAAHEAAAAASPRSFGSTSASASFSRHRFSSTPTPPQPPTAATEPAPDAAAVPSSAVTPSQMSDADATGTLPDGDESTHVLQQQLARSEKERRRCAAHCTVHTRSPGTPGVYICTHATHCER